MDERLIPKGGANPYADHPGFDAQACPLQYTVTQRGAYGGVRGGFGCEMTGGHCLPGGHCEARRQKAREMDEIKAACAAAKG